MKNGMYQIQIPDLSTNKNTQYDNFLYIGKIEYKSPKMLGLIYQYGDTNLPIIILGRKIHQKSYGIISIEKNEQINNFLFKESKEKNIFVGKFGQPIKLNTLQQVNKQYPLKKTQYDLLSILNKQKTLNESLKILNKISLDIITNILSEKINKETIKKRIAFIDKIKNKSHKNGRYKESFTF